MAMFPGLHPSLYHLQYRTGKGRGWGGGGAGDKAKNLLMEHQTTRPLRVEVYKHMYIV